ncbi:hypothetical protein [Nitrobacter sp. JJSN]|uniref:hypothetical protein n=1 Tax=Nitrobacter sp. JJSN TaxID=3453033 RepID=UPI003F757F17
MNVAAAIEQFTTHVRKFSHMVVVDTIDINAPTPERIAAHKAQVERLCDEMDTLAGRSPTLDEFEAVRQQLYAINATAPLGHLRAVQDAFLATT